MISKAAVARAELRSCLTRVYEKRLARLVLFGSQARGNADTGSDVDIMVVLKGPVRPGTEIARTGEMTAPCLLSTTS